MLGKRKKKKGFAQDKILFKLIKHFKKNNFETTS